MIWTNKHIVNTEARTANMGFALGGLTCNFDKLVGEEQL